MWTVQHASTLRPSLAPRPHSHGPSWSRLSSNARREAPPPPPPGIGCQVRLRASYRSRRHTTAPRITQQSTAAPRQHAEARRRTPQHIAASGSAPRGPTARHGTRRRWRGCVQCPHRTRRRPPVVCVDWAPRACPASTDLQTSAQQESRANGP